MFDIGIDAAIRSTVRIPVRIGAAAAVCALTFGALIATPTAARAALITYEFQNATATGPWDVYQYPLTVDFTGSFTFDTLTATASNTGGFDVLSTSGYSDVENIVGYISATDTLVTIGLDNWYKFITFSSSLDAGDPASITSVAFSNSSLQYQGVNRVGTAQTGGLIVTYNSAIPEPATYAVLGLGLGALAMTRRRRA